MRGCLTVQTVESGQCDPHEFAVEAGSAVVTLPGQPVQLRNDTQANVTVLYIVTPGYVSDDAYDDAVLLDDWASSLSDEDLTDARMRRAAAAIDSDEAVALVNEALPVDNEALEKAEGGAEAKP